MWIDQDKSNNASQQMQSPSVSVTEEEASVLDSAVKSTNPAYPSRSKIQTGITLKRMAEACMLHGPVVDI
jgi:hypothetical protein